MRNLINITDLTVEEIDKLIATADDIEVNPEKYRDACAHKKLATLFFEPSTRTRLSFEAAMLELGGSVLGFSDAGSSSSTKGESVRDTVRIVGNYADIIAMRHPKEGAPIAAAQKTVVPIINAGDGGHFHPTQTLTDLLTIKRKKGRLDNLTIGLCGDLKFGRTVHSLVDAMLRYENVKFVLISPPELRMPEYVKNRMNAAGAAWMETETLEDSLEALDILYMTRIQKERFDSAEEYERLKDSYVLDTEKLKSAKSNMIILHPLPRVNEISVEVDDDPRACYFYQALCGKHIRMALILYLLELIPGKGAAGAGSIAGDAGSNTGNIAESISEGIAGGGNEEADNPERCGERRTLEQSHETEPHKSPEIIRDDISCTNPKCITSTEQELNHLFRLADGKRGIYRCVYCDGEYRK